jgi:hypothetical protein
MAQSFELDPTLRDKYLAGLRLFADHIRDISEVWPHLTPEQRQKFRDHSPLFDAFLRLVELTDWTV